ncbi:MAG: ATP-binding cassette domain-containing protein, partial [Verrucomicrobiota bacterium]
MNSDPLLAVHDLEIAFENDEGASKTAVKEISFSIGKGESVAVVGESGSGKSVTAL